MDFVSSLSNIANKRIETVQDIKESAKSLPLVLHGGERSANAAKEFLLANGIEIAMHCTDAKYSSKRPDLLLLEDVHKTYPLYNVFLGVMVFAPVLDAIKNVPGINHVYYCDLDGYISGRGAFDINCLMLKLKISLLFLK